MFNKKFFSILLVVACIGMNAQNAATKTTAKKKEVQMANVILYSVVLTDTTKASTVAANYGDMPLSLYHQVEENRYLTSAESRRYFNLLNGLLKNPNVLFCAGFTSKITKESAMSRMIKEFHVEAYDSLGNVVGTKVVYDTISLYVGTRITFAESWNINPETGEIKKEVLGWMLDYFDRDKYLWRPLFGIVKDETSRQKLVEAGY